MNNLSNEQIYEIMAAFLIVPTSKVNGISFDLVAKALRELLERREAAEKPIIYQYREIGEGDWIDCNQHWWGYCKESPEHDTRELFTAPPLPAVPDIKKLARETVDSGQLAVNLPYGLIEAVKFYEQVQRENTAVETGAWKDATDWVLKEAIRAAGGTVGGE